MPLERFEAIGEEESDTQRFAIRPLERGLGHEWEAHCDEHCLVDCRHTHFRRHHEFDTIQVLTEDVTDIILNLKDIVLRVHAEIASLFASMCVVRNISSHRTFIHTPSVEILNGECSLADTSNSKIPVAIDITVDQGAGYVGADRDDTSTIGVIPIDSIYSPVRRVAFDVTPPHRRRPTSTASSSTSSPTVRSAHVRRFVCWCHLAHTGAAAWKR